MVVFYQNTVVHVSSKLIVRYKEYHKGLVGEMIVLKLKYNTNIYLLWVPFKDYSGFSLRRHFALNVEIGLSILFVFTIRHKHCVVINFNMTHKIFSCQKKICLDCDAYIECVCIRFQQCKVWWHLAWTHWSIGSWWTNFFQP